MSWWCDADQFFSLSRFDSISDEWNESGNESWESGWMTVSSSRSSETLYHSSLFTTIEYVGGRHPFWSVGSTPCFSRIPPSPSGSSPRLPLGSPGKDGKWREMATGSWRGGEGMKKIMKESQESGTRDSGIDTSSCFTSSEESARDRDCQNPRKVGETSSQSYKSIWLPFQPCWFKWLFVGRLDVSLVWM